MVRKAEHNPDEPFKSPGLGPWPSWLSWAVIVAMGAIIGAFVYSLFFG